MNTELAASRPSKFTPALTTGFGAALALACTWFITHLPGLGADNRLTIPIILTAWLLALVVGVTRLPRRRAVATGAVAGLCSGILGAVFFFGTKLALPPATDNSAAGVIPSAPLLIAGFLGLSLALGVLAGAIGWLITQPTAIDRPPGHWLARFALITALSVAPLIFVGGLVTSTQSGMAVPDWPNTFGANMFLYPLSSHSPPDVYLEHSHRLFGAFVGLTTLTLLALTFAHDRRGWVRTLAVVAFALICLQGVLGGVRVTSISRVLAMVHGVLAQLTFGTICALAVVLSDHFRALMPGRPIVDASVARRARRWCTAATHTLILQLIMGAWYRHFRVDHPLWTHILLSVVVLGLVLMAGFTLSGSELRASPIGRRTAQIGIGMVGCVFVQFLLGWATFIWGGKGLQAEGWTEALLRTAHQANGAMLIGLTAAAFVWGKRLGRGLTRSGPVPAAPAAPSAAGA